MPTTSKKEASCSREGKPTRTRASAPHSVRRAPARACTAHARRTRKLGVAQREKKPLDPSHSSFREGWPYTARDARETPRVFWRRMLKTKHVTHREEYRGDDDTYAATCYRQDCSHRELPDATE